MSHLQLRKESLLPQESVDALQVAWGQRFTGLDELGRLILVTAHAEGGVSHGRIQTLTDAHSRDVTLKLQEPMRNGLLASSGGGRRRTYALPLKGSEESSKGSEESSEESSQSPEESPGRKRAWAPREQLVMSTLDFCRGAWRTLPEIATALGRAVSTVRTEYLRSLLEQARLERRYPDNPNHPNQAYRTVEGHQ